MRQPFGHVQAYASACDAAARRHDVAALTKSRRCRTTVYVGRKDRLLELNNDALPDVWRPLVESCAPGDAGKSARTAMPKGEGLEAS